MILTFSPQAGLPDQSETEIRVAGDVLTIDGVEWDFTAIPEGGEGAFGPEDNVPFIGPIRRIDNVITATVIVRLGVDACADQPADPAHWIIQNADGDVAIPAIRKPEPEA